MNFVADEGVDAQIVTRLRQAGHQVWYVAEMSPGVPDTAVLNLANQVNAILITADKDFGDLVYRQRQVTQGVVLFRLHGLTAERKAELGGWSSYRPTTRWLAQRRKGAKGKNLASTSALLSTSLRLCARNWLKRRLSPELVTAMVQRHGAELPKAFTVLTPQKVRVRPQLN